MANNPYVNKVVYGGNTLIDISDTTAIADDVASGKYFYTASGQKIEGTATLGGSVTQDVNGFIVLPTTGAGRLAGLEYETGTWTPEADATTGWIQLANIYTVAPAYYAISDTNSERTLATAATLCLTYYNWHQMVGSAIRTGSDTYDYGNVCVRSNSYDYSIQELITTPYTSSSNTSPSHSRYWATETRIRAHLLNQGSKWLAGHTYKWIAVWAPAPI